jgi:hypothetical protein
MPEAKEVTIKIDDSFTGTVCDYSVGFLKFRQDGKHEVAEPAGTGTFVKLGRVYGILTAAHVLKELGSEGTIGLVRFPSVQPPIQNRRLNLQLTDRLVEWNGKECDAPDIAFLKIPELDGRQLEANGAIFYNFNVAREFAVSEPGRRMGTSHAVVGVVGEWTEEHPAIFTQGLKITVGGLFGAAKNLRSFKEAGTDLIEVEIDYANGPRVPKSHGGVSGGALWELHIELDANLKAVNVNKRLHGVAFRQSGDHKRVTSNAKPSIAAMIEKIRDAWPEAVNVG